ncbi:jg2834 [Pararge aegeria aegeria]|uniref:Jg2834 protein n=1 Tax=Pararge aegeria aegeria TaxID=348720 RepID=A0A8S4QI60_9NEOP|nr:jg2834 [Pararge aegeria aegeria]
MDVGVPRCWNGSPVLVSAALVDPQRGGQTTLSASQVAVESKRLRIVELGTPYKRPMSSSGRLSVDVMMMMKKNLGRSPHAAQVQIGRLHAFLHIYFAVMANV